MRFRKCSLSSNIHGLWSGMGSAASFVITGIVAVFLYIFTAIRFQLQVRGLDNFTVSPATIIAVSHKRDLDEVICLSNLHMRRILFRPRFRIRIAARDDLFERGFLPTHFKLPGFIAWLLSMVNISLVMKAIGALPIGRLTHSNTGRLLRDVYQNEGNKKLADILKQESITEFASLLSPQLNSNLENVRLKDFLCYKYSAVHAQSSVYGILRKDVSQRTKVFLLEKVLNQLERFSNILDKGGIVFMTPGYDHSPDGRFGAVKSGIYRLITMADSDVRILPVNITYDSLNTGQMRIHVTVGQELINLSGLSNEQVEDLLRIAITRLETVNMGHLGSYCLYQMAQAGSKDVTREILADRIVSLVGEFSEKGLTIDRGIFMNSGKLQKRLRGFIDYCLKHGWLQHNSNGSYLLNTDALMDVSEINELQYSCNELMAFQEAQVLKVA